MSNNKSRILARKTGTHLVGTPFRPEKKFEDIEDHRAFIKQITGLSSTEEVIPRFAFILKQFKTNSDLIDRISATTKIEQSEIKRKLDLFSRLYTSTTEIWELFGRKQW